MLSMCSPRNRIEIDESRRASFTRALGIGSETPSIGRNSVLLTVKPRRAMEEAPGGP